MAHRGSFLVVFLVAFGVTVVLTPLCRRLAVRLKVVTLPGPRRVNTTIQPMLGGLALLAGFLVALVVAWQMSDFSQMFQDSSVPLAVAAAAVCMCAVGTVDDVREISPPAKTAGMVLSASILYLLGVSMIFLRIPFAGILVLSSDWAPLVSVLWVLGMANAINFIDGLDGLAAGIVAIAAGSFFVYGYKLMTAGALGVDNPSPLLAAIVCGICLGFLPHNFHPAKVIMGDGGALLLGLLMAASTMLVGGQNDDPFSGQVYFFFAPLLIPIVILGVPILDTAWAIVRRTRSGTSPAMADKGHLHHRLMNLGHGQRRSVVILWLWTFLLSGFVLYPVFTGKGDAVVPLGIAALGLVLYTLLHPRARQSRGARQAAPAVEVFGEAPGDPTEGGVADASEAPAEAGPAAAQAVTQAVGEPTTGEVPQARG